MEKKSSAPTHVIYAILAFVATFSEVRAVLSHTNKPPAVRFFILQRMVPSRRANVSTKVVSILFHNLLTNFPEKTNFVQLSGYVFLVRPERDQKNRA